MKQKITNLLLRYKVKFQQDLVIDKLIKDAQNYYHYILNLINHDSIEANIQVIKSERGENKSLANGEWESSTRGKFSTFDGGGTHPEMPVPSAAFDHNLNIHILLDILSRT